MNSGMSVTDGKNKLIIVTTLLFLIKFIIASNVCISIMFPRMEGEMLCILLKWRGKCLWWTLHMKNGIWLYIAADTWYSYNIPGDKQGMQIL